MHAVLLKNLDIIKLLAEYDKGLIELTIKVESRRMTPVYLGIVPKWFYVNIAIFW